MDTGIVVCESDAGPHLPLLDDTDDSRLEQLGYKQELSRNLSALANFSVSLTVVSVLTGLNTLYDSGLTYGGPLTMIWGWPIVGALTFTVGSSMAEICSAYPTSGGLYFWSAKLCGNEWGPFASWFTGWVFMYRYRYSKFQPVKHEY
ncbi:AA_permease_2 domain-containing protein, partial [Cephalotus follicularis]